MPPHKKSPGTFSCIKGPISECGSLTVLNCKQKLAANIDVVTIMQSVGIVGSRLFWPLQLLEVGWKWAKDQRSLSWKAVRDERLA